jgi:hypothetical protein
VVELHVSSLILCLLASICSVLLCSLCLCECDVCGLKCRMLASLTHSPEDAMPSRKVWFDGIYRQQQPFSDSYTGSMNAPTHSGSR